MGDSLKIREATLDDTHAIGEVNVLSIDASYEPGKSGAVPGVLSMKWTEA